MPDYDIFKEWALTQVRPIEGMSVMVATKFVYDWLLGQTSSKMYRKRMREETAFGQAVSLIINWERRGLIVLHPGQFGASAVMELVK